MNMIGTLRRVIDRMRNGRADTHYCRACHAQRRTVAVMDGGVTEYRCQQCGAVLGSWREPPEEAKVRLRQLGEYE